MEERLNSTVVGSDWLPRSGAQADKSLPCGDRCPDPDRTDRMPSVLGWGRSYKHADCVICCLSYMEMRRAPTVARPQNEHAFASMHSEIVYGELSRMLGTLQTGGYKS